MDEQPTPQQEIQEPPLRRYYGEDRRRLFQGEYKGAERRIAEPLTEQDEDPEPPPS